MTNLKITHGVIILAAGQGKRMRSSLPKVLHEIGGLPLLSHIIRSVQSVAPQASIAVVVGHAREQVEASARADSKAELSFIHQAEQRGTGHAARCAIESPWGEEILRQRAPILVLPGDLPLITNELIRQMLLPLGRTDAMRLLTCHLPNPAGYGRVVRRGKKGGVLRIVEEKDASLREKAIDEVAASIYTFQSTFLRYALSKLSNKNAQGEFYLTDLVAAASRAKKRVDILKWTDAEDLRGVNDPWELAQARAILNERCVRSWSLHGVKFVDPKSVSLDVTVQLAQDVVVHPGAILRGSTEVGAGATIGAYSNLSSMKIGERANIKHGTVGEQSIVESGASVGPYAHLRPESRVGRNAKIGNFVELKKTTIGEETSVAHLSYLGDAEVGRRVNIGCGFVTCNFDGRVINGQRKHRTIIEDDVFLGSDCQTVAPVKIGKGAYVASGSTITENVEPEALAIARSRQTNKPGYAKRMKEGQ